MVVGIIVELVGASESMTDAWVRFTLMVVGTVEIVFFTMDIFVCLGVIGAGVGVGKGQIGVGIGRVCKVGIVGIVGSAVIVG